MLLVSNDINHHGNFKGISRVKRCGNSKSRITRPIWARSRITLIIWVPSCVKENLFATLGVSMNMENKNKKFVFHSSPTEHNTDRLTTSYSTTPMRFALLSTFKTNVILAQIIISGAKQAQFPSLRFMMVSLSHSTIYEGINCCYNHPFH